MGIQEAIDRMRTFKEVTAEARVEMEGLNAVGQEARDETFVPLDANGAQQVVPGNPLGTAFTPGGPGLAGTAGSFVPIIVGPDGRPIQAAPGTVSSSQGGGGGGGGFQRFGPTFGPTVSGSSGGGGGGGGGSAPRFTPGPPTLTGATYLGGNPPGLQTAGSGVTAGDELVAGAVERLAETIERNSSGLTGTDVRAHR